MKKLQDELTDCVENLNSDPEYTDLSLCLIYLNRIKRSVYSLQPERINKAKIFCEKIKKPEMLILLDLLQSNLILKKL